MARKSKGNAAMGPISGMGEDRTSVSIEGAENGSVIRVSSGGPEKPYTSKTFVAPTHDAAVRIASSHMEACGPKGKGKKGKGKKGKSKIQTSKRG
jgi:hypothetical protein